MAFWTDNNFEPKQEFQFKIIFNVFNYNYDIGWQYVSSCDKPSYQINEKSYKLINTQIKYPTNMIWADVNMELIDTTDNRVLAFLNVLNDLQSENDKYFSGATVKNNCGTYDSPDKNKIGKIFIEIQTLDKEGVPVEIWKLQGAWIKSVKQSQLNYGSENISKINLTLSYDWAEILLNSPVIPDVASAAAGITKAFGGRSTSITDTRDGAQTAAEAALEAYGLRNPGFGPTLGLQTQGVDLSNLSGPSTELDNGFSTRSEPSRRFVYDKAATYTPGQK